MKKRILIPLVMSFLGTGCMTNTQTLCSGTDALKIETINAFMLPAGVQHFCSFSERSWQQQNFRIIRADLNSDGTDEILLECRPVNDSEKKLDCNRTWVVLQKAFNGDYICIGKIGTPVWIKKRAGCTWNEIMGYKLPEVDFWTHEKRVPAFSLYNFSQGEYIALANTGPKPGLTPKQATEELCRIKQQKFPEFSDTYRKMINTAGDLYLSIELFDTVLNKLDPEQRKELLIPLMPDIRRINSRFLRSIYAKKAAQMLMDLNDCTSASEMFELALRSQLQDNPLDSCGYADTLSSYAVLLSRSGNSKAAEKKFAAALQLYRAAAKKDAKYNYDLASALAEYAIFHYEEEKYAESEKKLLESVQIFESLPSSFGWGEKQLSNSGSAYGMLALIYEKTGRDAEVYYSKALKTFSRIKKPRTEFFRENHADTLYNASEFHKKNGNIEKALDEQKKAFEILNKLSGDNPVYLPKLLKSAYSMTCLMQSSGDVENALPLLNEILKYRLQLAEKNEEESVSAYFDTVCSTVTAYLKLQKYAQAQQLLKTAEKQKFHISKKVQNQLKTAKAAVYHRLGQFEKSAELLESILKDNVSGEEFASASYHLGRSLSAAKQFTKAEKVLADGIAVLKKGTPDIWLVRCLNQLAMVHWNTRNFRLAEKEYQDAVSTFEKLKGGEAVLNIKAYAVASANLASLYRDTGRTSDAYTLYLKVVPALKQNSILANPEKAELLRNFGNTCMDLDKFDEAESNYRAALSICEQKAQDNNVCAEKIAEIHFNLGNLFCRTRQFGKAEKEYLASGELYHELGKNSKKTSCFMRESQAWNNLANMYSNMREKGKAEKYFTAAMTLRKKYAENASDRASLAQTMFNLAWHYFQNEAYEKAAALFAEGVRTTRTLNREVPGKYELLLARFLIFHALTCGDSTNISKIFDEIESLLNKHSGTPEAKQLRDIFKKVKDSKTKQVK